MTADVAEHVASLRSILASRNHPTREGIFSSLAFREDAPVLSVPPTLAPQPEPPLDGYQQRVRPVIWWESLLGRRARFEREWRGAEEQYRADHLRWQEYERSRLSQIADIHRAYDQSVLSHREKADQRGTEIRELRAGCDANISEAVTTFFEIVLEQSVWPEDFPHEYQVAYDRTGKQLLVEYELPCVDVIPPVAEYRYIKSKDSIEEKARKPAEIKDLYREIVSAVALRCIDECFAADEGHAVSVLTFNGFVNTIDRSTGNPCRPYLISVRVTKERFQGIMLDQVDTKACLRNLGAQVSPQPAELLPVRPIVEFNMVDRRFIDEKNVISELDSRPNLMDLTPSEFEALVSNLFTRMGLETKLTRTSRDGGVDAIAYDKRPILGGKVVIQAKRWSHTVGVSAVRDLYGTMMNEGANKGILVTTSGYGPDAYDFCRDKPVELIDGSGLLYQLEEVGVRARIILPEDRAAAS
jgi:restriction system protein